MDTPRPNWKFFSLQTGWPKVEGSIQILQSSDLPKLPYHAAGCEDKADFDPTHPVLLAFCRAPCAHVKALLNSLVELKIEGKITITAIPCLVTIEGSLTAYDDESYYRVREKLTRACEVASLIAVFPPLRSLSWNAEARYTSTKDGSRT